MTLPISNVVQNYMSPEARVTSPQNLLPDPITGAMAHPKFEPLSVLTGQSNEYIETHSKVNNVVQGLQGSNFVSKTNTQDILLDAIPAAEKPLSIVV